MAYLFQSKQKAGLSLIDKQADEKAANKEIVMELFERQEKVTNDDVEKLLSVSNATAERYLNELEKEGRIRQVGTTGQNVHYERI